MKFLLLAIVALLSLPAAYSQQSGSVAEQYLLAAANQERAALGLQPLRSNPLLTQAATQHALQMADHGTISHQFPGEPELTARASATGLGFSVVAENVGEAPSAVLLHDLWMKSEHHRENLLDPALNSIGIRVIPRGRELYAVEDFAKAVPNVPLPQQEFAIASLLSVPVDQSPSATAAARQTCAMSTGYVGARKPWFVMRFTSDSLSVLPAELSSRLASGRYRQAAVGACAGSGSGPFASYNIAVLLYP